LSPDPNHAEVLRSGPKAWNAWREKNPSIVPDLAGIALKSSERQMGPTNEGPINLKSARLQDAVLRFATLSAADLEAADMSGADLAHARFDHANLSAANLSSALLDYADFAGAKLVKVNLCGARLPFATLSTADLDSADMSGADLVHARFDQTNLSAANLSNAQLDHADFAGANLTKVNLCGASLHHAKNLTQAQLEETIGSDSTILPPPLRGSVSWSVARTETTALERRDLRIRARPTADVDVPHISSYNRPVWILGVLLIGGALVTTGFVWRHMPHHSSGAQRESKQSLPEPKLSLDTGDEGLQPSVPEALMDEKAAAERPPSADAASAVSTVDEAVPLNTSGAQRESKQSLPEPKLSLDTGDQGLQPSAPEALMEEKAAAERPPSADAEIPTSAASTMDRTESVEQRLALEKGRETVPQETNAHAELQASDGAEQSTEAFGPNEHAPGNPEEGLEPKSNEATSRHGTVPDVPAEASISDPQFTPAKEGPAETLAVNTPDPSAASSLSETLRPPVVAPLPSSVMRRDVQTALAPSAEAPPTPVRNPSRPHEVKGQNSDDKKTEAPAVLQKDVQTVLAPIAETPPTPVRNPARPRGTK